MMALGGVQGANFGNLLSSLSSGKAVGKGPLSGMDVPRMKAQKGPEAEDAEQGRGVGRQ